MIKIFHWEIKLISTDVVDCRRLRTKATHDTPKKRPTGCNRFDHNLNSNWRLWKDMMDPIKILCFEVIKDSLDFV